MFEVAEELSVGIKDEPGSLAAVLKVVADAGCAVRAFCGYSMAGAGNVMIVPDDAKKARAALKKAGYKEIESSKVVVGTTKDKKGAGATITEQARTKGINLEYAYATGTGKGTGVIVLAAGGSVAKLAKQLNS
jgi:hypothetical protein